MVHMYRIIQFGIGQYFYSKKSPDEVKDILINTCKELGLNMDELSVKIGVEQVTENGIGFYSIVIS